MTALTASYNISKIHIEAPTPEAVIRAQRDRAYGEAAARIACDFGARFIELKPGEGYRDRSRALKRLSANVDSWPVPPAGLFVVAERTVYANSLSPMTIAHEWGHALDAAFGGGIYLSSVDPRFRKAFKDARRFVTPYAASGLDEYAAEGFRAYISANDSRWPWPAVTRRRLREIDPTLHDIIGRC
jgi:hypothetical protein